MRAGRRHTSDVGFAPSQIKPSWHAGCSAGLFFAGSDDALMAQQQPDSPEANARLTCLDCRKY